MSTNFPSALDAFTNPNGSDSLNAAAVPHAEQHANANDAIEALQAKVGINGSAVATSLDYRISTAETGLGGKISSSEKGSANGVATLGFDGMVPSSQVPPLDYIPTSEKGAAGGVAGLDEAGKVPAAQLPSYVDDVLEYANLAAFPVTGEAGKIYVALDTNKTYRWSGSAYIYITSGAVDSVAGKTGVVVLAKADVGLGSVDDTSDANKPISTAAQAALDTKAPLSHVGATGAAHGVATTSVAGFMSSADKTKLDGVAISANNYTHPSGDGNLHVPATGTTNSGKVLKAGATAGSLGWGTLDKADVGLSNVDNTADVAKPISTAQQTALDLKAPLNSPALTGKASITANTTSPALTITQTGTGEALRVEDASGDTTPFVIDANGQVCVACSSAAVVAAPEALSISSNGVTVAQNLVGLAYRSENAFGPTQEFYKSRGTNTAPTIVVNGDQLGVLRAWGYDGSAYKVGAQIASYVDGTPGLNDMPGRLVFSITGDGGSNPVERLRIDSTGNVLVKSVAGLGYGTGAGGTVTQATSKSTVVTLNKPCGQITMNNAALAAGASVVFIVNNSLTTLNDLILINLSSGVTDSFNYKVETISGAAGTFRVKVTNLSAVSLSEALVLNFAVLKGATA